MHPKVVIVYGPPGAGKGTQANLLADIFGFIHFDTGKYIERLVHDPAHQDDPVIRKERENFDSGRICTPSWVLQQSRKKALYLTGSGFGVVFSGSPRSEFEAFGDADHEGLLAAYEKAAGKENIVSFLLHVKPETSILRNSKRLLCSLCGIGIMGGNYSGDTCPRCASPLHRRSLDVPDVIKVRLQKYEEMTFPIIAGMKERGYSVRDIDGEPPPHEVFKAIQSALSE